MNLLRWVFALLLCTAACSRSSDTASVPVEQREGPSAAEASSGTVDLDRIFPAGAGRELVLNNCQNCHTFVPIVILQMDKDAWARNSRDHRDRVPTLSDQEFTTLYDYLTANFNPDRPVPTLPRQLLDSWTSY